MSDTQVLETPTQEAPVQPDLSLQLQEAMWNDKPIVRAEPSAEPAKPNPTPEVVVDTEKKDDVFNEDDYIKNKYGYESSEVLAKELEEYKKLKEAKPAEVKYENENSRKLHEAILSGDEDKVYSILSEKKQVERVSKLDVTKPNEAAEIVKLNLQLKYPTLDQSEITDIFNEQYSKPPKPNTSDLLDDEVTQVMNDWQQRCDAIDRKIVRDGKMAKPELDQYSTKLVLPGIPRQDNQAKAPTQEELDKAKRYDESYIQSVDSSIKEFNGFSVVVKNEAVGLPETSISYGVVDNEKSSLAQELKDFVKTGYDANSLLAQRWVNEDGTLKTKTIAEDRYFLENRDKILSKIANDSATKAVDAYIKGKKNINVNEASNTSKTTLLQNEGKTEMDTVRDQFFG